MTPASPQRAWRAACPNCGAPVEFASAASAVAVCGFCRSTLVRDGAALQRIGVSAELFDDHTPLQLGASGRHQGAAFTLVGRVQMAYDGGTWNEWHALFDGADGAAGRPAWLSEDNGAYVLSFESPLPADAPAGEAALAALRPGQTLRIDGRAWDVASVQRARVLAAEGELPSPPPSGTFTVVDLRSTADEVATLDAGGEAGAGGGPAPGAAAGPPAVAAGGVTDPFLAGPAGSGRRWSVGRSVALSALALQGLKDASEATLAGRTLSCPNCGAPLAVALATTQSVTCEACSAVVDVSQGVGGELQHYRQNNAGESGAEPLIALGRTGRLAVGDGTPAGDAAAQPEAWQVVGYQERCNVPDAADGDDEVEYWREYLLYRREQGFAFLVDSNDGWSLVRPVTGVPVVRGERAEWQSVRHRRVAAYVARTSWVQGEFYWRVKRDERVQVVDYRGEPPHGQRLLAREQAGGEVTWSAGRRIDAATVADAFGIAPSARAPLQRDAAPLSSSSGLSWKTIVVLVVVLLLVVLLMSRCSDDGCDETRAAFGPSSSEYRQCLSRSGSGSGSRGGGGWFGGSGSGGGGGHK